MFIFITSILISNSTVPKEKNDIFTSQPLLACKQPTSENKYFQISLATNSQLFLVTPPN